MEKIKLIVNKVDNHYLLVFDSTTILNVNSINLTIISNEIAESEYNVIYVDILENQYYKTKEVGAYKNTIFINHSGIDKMTESDVEIRLSLISKSQDNIKNVFIRVFKYL